MELILPVCLLAMDFAAGYAVRALCHDGEESERRDLKDTLMVPFCAEARQTATLNESARPV